MASNNNFILIKANTWGRDTHGFFDYEATNSYFSLLSLSSESDLIRKENDVRIINESPLEQSKRNNMLCHIRKVNGEFVLCSNLSYHLKPTEMNQINKSNMYIIIKNKLNIKNILSYITIFPFSSNFCSMISLSMLFLAPVTASLLKDFSLLFLEKASS